MHMFNIDDAGKRGLEALPETGMGFQLVEAMVMGDLKRLLVFNSEKAIDLSGIELSVSNDPAIVLRNGIRIVELLKSDVRQTIVMSPAPHSFKLLSTRIPPLHGLPAGAMSSMPVTAALPSSLVKHVKLKAPRAFHRFSAFTPDRRVNPLTGDFLNGTYASPASELPFLPTGFAVVGRIALRNGGTRLRAGRRGSRGVLFQGCKECERASGCSSRPRGRIGASANTALGR